MDSTLINTPDFQLTQMELIVRLLIALGAGFLIGLEREHAALTQKLNSFAGIRSFIFVALMGFSGMMMSVILDPWIFIGLLLSVLVLIGISYWAIVAGGDLGTTTELSLFLSYIIGGLIFLGFILFCLLVSVVVVVF